MSVLVSVVIPCFNAGRWIAETLQSVAIQGLDGVEVIAVNDGSSDNTAEVVRERFGFVRLLETTNRGVSHARNLGMSIAQGDFLQFLDADDLLAPGKLSKQVAAMNHTGADVSYGDWNRLEPSDEDNFRAGEIINRKMETEPEIALFTDFWCPLAAYLFRKEIVTKVSSWNADLPVIQDARFTLDCALHGAKFTYVSSVMASYRTHLHGSLSTRNPEAALSDQLRNAEQVEQWWRAHGGLPETRRRALLKVYGHIARASYEQHREIFAAACVALERINPKYIPSSPKSLAAVSRLTGYRTAESIALGYRRAKRVFTAA